MEILLQRRQSGLKTGGRGLGFENWGSWVLKVQVQHKLDTSDYLHVSNKLD